MRLLKLTIKVLRLEIVIDKSYILLTFSNRRKITVENAIS